MPAYVIAFESTHAAMAAGKALECAEIPHFTIPTPRAISAGCGIALKFESDSPSAVYEVARAAAGDSSLMSLHIQTGPRSFEPVDGRRC